MKKFLLILAITLFLSITFPIHAQMMEQKMTGSQNTATSKSEDEEVNRGKQVWENLQANKLDCQKMTDEDFENLGEFTMGQMMGNHHEDMNKMMKQMMGDSGERQLHIDLGKRISGCDQSNETNKLTLGSMMKMSGGEGTMMGSFTRYPANLLGTPWITVILVWVFLILAIIALVKWIFFSGKKR